MCHLDPYIRDCGDDILRIMIFHLYALAKPWSGLAMAMAMAITMYMIILWNKSEAHFHVMDCQKTAVTWVVNLKGKVSKFYLLALLHYNLWLWLSVHNPPKNEKSGSLQTTSELQSMYWPAGYQGLGDDAVNSKVLQISEYGILKWWCFQYVSLKFIIVW